MPSRTDSGTDGPRLGVVLGIAAVIGGIGVAAGAFGAHGLAGRIAPARLDTFETGVRYQLVHALALIGLAALLPRLRPGPARTVLITWTAGVAVFSGSLYLLVLTGVPTFGAITPLGGLLLIFGWGRLVGAARTEHLDRSGGPSGGSRAGGERPSEP